ncbi:MAG: winged helix-turn-helix transcriptional regulator [Nannocystaceae bacterium]
MSSSPKNPSSTRSSSEHVWTFLSNYAHVLVCIAREPHATLREISYAVGVTERAVHRIISELEAAEVVTHTREGRRNHYVVDTTVPLRHPLEEDKTVGDLLSVLLSPEEAAQLGLNRQR